MSTYIDFRPMISAIKINKILRAQTREELAKALDYEFTDKELVTYMHEIISMCKQT